MSTVMAGTLSVQAAAVGPEDRYPLVGTLRPGFDPVPPGSEADASVLPYAAQSSYRRDPVAVAMQTLVLDNGILRATFLPGLGGRLLSLVDLASGRETLHRPDALQPADLALRDAWIPGGVEWNLGVRGHWALTCAAVHAAIVRGPAGDGVRMWEWERLTGLVWRVDAWLPDGSESLIVRPRILNPGPDAAPLYWWSNIAVPQTERTAVRVEARQAVRFGYEGVPQSVPVPRHEGRDLLRPSEAPHAEDLFFEVESEVPWIAAVEPDGTGLLQASTAELRGRKLFVWGEASGGRRWQRWLSGRGRYVEIQAGLESTQFDYGLLDAGASREWTELYRPLRPGDDLAVIASHTAPALAATPPRGALETVEAGSGWGGLEIAAGHLEDDEAIPFPHPGPDQRAWVGLASRGTAPSDDAPPMRGRRWLERLAPGRAPLHRGYLLAGEGRLDEAAAEFAAARRTGSAAASRALGILARGRGDRAEAAELAREALERDPASSQLAVEATASALAADRSRDALDIVDALPADLRAHPRIRWAEAMAALRLGDADRARPAIAEPLELPDIREGDAPLERLWDAWVAVTGETGDMPDAWDFRMSEDPRGASA